MLSEISKGSNVISSKLSPPFKWIIAFKILMSSFFVKNSEKPFDKIRQKRHVKQ